MRARHAALLVLLALSACKPATQSAPAGSASAPRPPPAPSPVASPAPAPEKVLPLPPAPAGVDAEVVAIASSICAAAYVRESGAVGCRSHPPFVDEGQKPDGKLPAHTGDPYKLCAIEKVVRGAFTKPGAKQALLSFGSCYEDGEQFATNEANASSALLVEEANGRWTPVSYEAGLHASSCQKSRRTDGRDVLLCQSSMAAFRVGEITYFYLLDFARPDKHARTIAWMFGDVFDCVPFEREEPHLTSGLISLRVTNAALADRNADGVQDLVVDVERARVAPSAALDRQVKAACAKNARTTITAFLPPSTKTRLELVSKGDAFEPTPASRALLDRWESESPENMNGLHGAAPEPLTR